MVAEPTHAATVSAWLEENSNALGCAGLLGLFERAFAAVWREAHPTLGEVTLMAIARRVLFVGQERFGALSLVSVGSDGVCFDGLREHTAGLEPRALREALGFLLLELFTVLGRLTAEVLTPGLHAVLADVTLDGDARAESCEGQPAEPSDGVGKEPRP